MLVLLYSGGALSESQSSPNLPSQSKTGLIADHRRRQRERVLGWIQTEISTTQDTVVPSLLPIHHTND